MKTQDNIDQVSDSNESNTEKNNTSENRGDLQVSKQHKWKSAWDLTEKEKEKHKDKKKRKKSLVQIQQGLLDLMNISDPAVSGDNTQLRSLASVAVKINQHVDKNRNAKTSIPNLPEGKCLAEIIVDIDVDKVFKLMYETDSFFETIAAKMYGEVNNFSVSPWSTISNESEASFRTMHYEFPQAWAFSKYTMYVDQDQSKCDWCSPGRAYGVDSVSRSTGIKYADSFHIDMHTRLEAIDGNKTKLIVIANVVWDKQTILKSKIETETINGMKKYYDVVEKELISSISEPVTEKSKSQLNRNGLLRSLSTTQSTAQRKKRPVYSFDERTILVAFILVIVTLLIITIAMFKLAGSIASLSDRLLTLEYLLERCATSQCLAVYENET